jgi:hypothetical protein
VRAVTRGGGLALMMMMTVSSVDIRVKENFSSTMI